MNIAEFLLARIEEDETAARAATEGPWRHNPAKVWYTDEGKLALARMGNPFVTGGEEFVGAGPDDGNNETTIGVAVTGPENNPQSMFDAAHIARHDPARVLAECAVKRRIIEDLMDMRENGNIEFDPINSMLFKQWVNHFLIPFAEVYQDHPDYEDAR